MFYKNFSAKKYGNRKVEVNGITFDSVKEANRYRELLLLERAGTIQNLELQKKFVLIPTQREPDKYGHIGKGKVIERECAYIADFVYIDTETGRIIVEDTKGFRTKDYIIKRKLMLSEYGIRITEI